MQLSAIVPTHERSTVLRRCLETLRAQEVDPSAFEVVVVDDGSTPPLRDQLRQYLDRIRVVTNPANSGFATACNNGAGVAAGRYLVFLNNDTVPLEGWLDALVRHAEEHPQAAVVGSRLLFPDRSVQHAGVVICQDRIPRHLYAGFPGDHPAVNRSRRFRSSQ